MRFYSGSEDQPVDPLIASAEGIGATPAYRGLAYVVFEDLQLAAFANHIPSLTFEVTADDAAVDEATIVADLFAAAAVEQPDVAGLDRRWPGFGYSDGTLRGALEMLGSTGPLVPADDGTGLRLAPAGPAIIALDQATIGARPEQAQRVQRQRIENVPTDRLPAEILLSYYDVERDFQTGLQRAARGGGAFAGARVEQIELTAAIDAGRAKALAEKLLAERWARRSSATVSLSWRHLALRPGELVSLPDSSAVWKIRSITIERMTIELGLDRITEAALPDQRPADGGRVQSQPDAPHGPTILHVLDLPPLFESLPVTPRLWLAAAGTQPGWRAAEFSVSSDGATWQDIGTANGMSVMGTAVAGLAVAAPELLDTTSSVEVLLLHDQMLLQGCSDTALLAGANMALVGDELIQFGIAEAVGPSRYRLSRLLRGRRGTEAGISGHAADDRFVLLDPAMLMPFDPAPEWLGANLSVRAAGPGDPPTALPVTTVVLQGRALLTPSPVHLSASRLSDGGIRIQWCRRSRQGWGWTGGTDAPLAEQDERYRLHIAADGGLERSITITAPSYDYPAAGQVADCGALATSLTITVAQLSALAGPGAAAARSFFIPLNS
jgi:hypothetical protein